MPKSIRLEMVESPRQSQVWNSHIARHHYLGLATPVGRLIRYVILGDDGTVGAISFSEAAWSITGRDEVLSDYGLDRDEIRSVVVSNNRFLILPNVHVRNLASRILALATKQVVLDWATRFATQPLFIETFVDPSRFEGICYRAANWSLIGRTKGFAKQGASHHHQKCPKLIFLYGTTSASRQFLANRYTPSKRRAA